MCGICGFWRKGARAEAERASLESAVEALRHRGPDEGGVLVEAAGGEEDGAVALGHARLSIIDLEGGRQPIANEDGSAFVIANGEIYNFAELRDALESRGHRFRTRSDTEVILHLWEDEGTACVEKLRGMFAFVIWDRNRKCLYGARDRFGQKPLFLSREHGALAFASEVKALLRLSWVSRRIDPAGIDQFLFYQFVPHPRTLFAAIEQLPPASWFRFDGARLEIERYWRPEFPSHDEREQFSNENEPLAALEAKLLETVEAHLVSDVPVGVFLSGGIDSSLVLAMAAKRSPERLQSFSIAFPGDREDESSFARIAAAHAGSEHREFPFRPLDLAQGIESLARIFDQPLADPAALPLSFLSGEAAREVKVVLTGDGGDELFAGYEKYRRGARGAGWLAPMDRLSPCFFAPTRLAAVRRDPLRLRKLRARLALGGLSWQECLYFKSFWEGWERERLYTPEFRERLPPRFESLAEGVPRDRAGRLHPVDRMLLADQLGYLPDDLLLKTDLATMAHGLEARAPLLDHELAAVAASLSPGLKATQEETKVALRRIAKNWIPKELIERRKQGFAVPLVSWFRGELRDWLKGQLLDGARTVPAYFRRERVEAVLDEHARGERNHASRIYALVVLELWHREFLS